MTACALNVTHLKPKSWAEFQHYKHRSPPWIRLHRNLLDNYDFQCLPVASRALAPMLWLLASESKDGVFDAAPEKLAFRLRMTADDVADAINPLIDSGFFMVASESLAPCLQGAGKVLIQSRDRVETETEFLNQGGTLGKSRDSSRGADGEVVLWEGAA